MTNDIRLFAQGERRYVFILLRSDGTLFDIIEGTNDLAGRIIHLHGEGMKIKRSMITLPTEVPPDDSPKRMFFFRGMVKPDVMLYVEGSEDPSFEQFLDT